LRYDFIADLTVALYAYSYMKFGIELDRGWMEVNQGNGDSRSAGTTGLTGTLIWVLPTVETSNRSSISCWFMDFGQSYAKLGNRPR